MILTAEARKAHRAPAPDVELMHRILVALAGHSSKRPARSIDLRAKLGADVSEFHRALEKLNAERLVNTASVFRKGDGVGHVVVWISGIAPKNDPWLALNARGLFAIHPSHTIPPRFPQKLDHDRDPRPDLVRVTAGARSHRTRGEADALRARIAAAVQGKPQQDGLTVKQLAATLGVTAAAINHLIKDSPRIARAPACGKPAAGKKPDVVFDPFAEEVTA